MDVMLLTITVLSLLIWVGLLGFRGQFWRTDICLEDATCPEMPAWDSWPSVCAVIPARNEAELLPLTLPSLLRQDYPGQLSVILVDDRSTDGTAEVSRKLARELNLSPSLEILTAPPLPRGWTGKLWAMEQGIRHGQQRTPPPDYFLFADADIEHDRTNLRQLVVKAEKEKLELVSVMVRLRCQEFWEKLLIPAFVFFFQKLYPFGWVNDPKNPTAAAAGGCILLRRQGLVRIGGLEGLREALIDDCALAQAVKHSTVSKTDESIESKSIWLGLSDKTRSLRPYPSLSSLWDLVARTAYTQLNYSPLLLVGTLLGMTLTYLVPPMAAVVGGMTGDGWVAIVAVWTWLLMAGTYLPMLRFYQRSPLLALALPAIAFLYTLMTIDSALRYYQGRGGAWKGRVYPK